MKNKVVIIIVTYNGMKWLSKCLESTSLYSVIVVDNNSTDGTVDFIKTNYPHLKLYEQNENLGFGKANNIGISKALSEGADYVFLLNQDAYLQENCLVKLLQVHQKNESYGILSPVHLNGTGTRLDANFSHYVNCSGNIDFLSDHVLNKSIKQIYTVPRVNAAGWLISRKCLETVGGFDPIFYHYGEDDNYCHRLKYHGFKIGVIPDAKLLHDRENRSSQEIVYGDIKYFQTLERQLKLKYSNINKTWGPELNNLIRKRKKAYLKTILKMDFKKASFLKKEYLMLQCLKTEVLLSRETNVLPGLNYLKFKDHA